MEPLYHLLSFNLQPHGTTYHVHDISVSLGVAAVWWNIVISSKVCAYKLKWLYCYQALSFCLLQVT